MAYEFKKLSEVLEVETANSTAKVLIEEEGIIKKVPKDEVGGLKEVDWEIITNKPKIVTSWNDLEDKPFDVKTELVEIVPKQSFTKNGTYGEANRFYITGDYDFSTLPVNINGGQPDVYEGEYTIVFNDVTYKCNYSYPPVIFPDDFKAMGLTTIHDCPFELIFFSDGFDLVWNPALGDTITFGAYIEQEVIKPIDPKFVGGATIYVNANDEKNIIYKDKGRTKLLTVAELEKMGTNIVVYDATYTNQTYIAVNVAVYSVYGSVTIVQENGAIVTYYTNEYYANAPS